MSFTRSIQQTVETMLGDINTQSPGTIVSYDAATNRAIVKPTLPKRLANDEELQSPQIVEVPVVWTSSGGGKAGITFPLQPGDGVMLSFQQRSMEGWLNGKNTMPDDPRQFDLSDCVAIPGLQASGISAHSDDVVLKFDKTIVTLKKDGSLVMGNDKGGITIDADGNITIKGQSIKVDTPAKAFTLETHRHEFTKSDPADNSGQPKAS